jgi:hypothetical protein
LFHPGDKDHGAQKWREEINGYIPDPEYRGYFPGLDYMVLYNAFHLKWQDQLPPYKRTLSCECVEEITTETELNAPLEVNMKFHDYREKGIPIESFLAHTITAHEAINVDNDLIVCRANEPDPTTIFLESGSSLTLKDANTLTVRAGNKIVANALTSVILGAEGSFEGSTTTVFEAGAEMDLKNGSVLEVSRGSHLYFKDGAKLRIEDLARISVDNTSAIHFENGAQLVYNGGFIELNDWDARIVLNNGQIIVKQDKVFSIVSQPFVSSGLIKVEAASSELPTFVLGQNARVNLTGESEQDLLLHCDNNSQVVVHGTTNDPLFVFKKCLVDLGDGSSIGSDVDMWTEHASFKAGETGHSSLYGSKIIFDVVNCTLDRVAISNFRSKLKVFTSSFNQDGNWAIESTGGLFEVFKSQFVGGGIYSGGLEFASRVSSSTFDLQNGVFAIMQNALEDESLVEIRIKDCSFKNCDHGLLKTGGMLTVACSNFDRCNFGVFGGEGCTVNLSDRFGGYNTFSDGDINIGLKNAQDLLLYYGYNNFLSYGEANMKGSLNRECSTDYCNGGLLNASGNQWPSYVPGGSGSNGDYALTPGSGGSVNNGPEPEAHLLFTSGALPSDCANLDEGSFPNNECPIFVAADEYFTSSRPCEIIEPYSFKPERRIKLEPNESGAHQLRDLSISENLNNLILSGDVFWGFSLDSAIHAASSYMTFYADTLGNDEFALQLFYDILTDTVVLHSPYKSVLALPAIQHMKTCFENSSVLDTTSAPEVKFSASYVAQYLDVLNLYTDTVVSLSNYHSQFTIEAYKGQFLFSLGLAHEANEVFQHLSDCPVDSLEQSILNNWRLVLDEIDTIGFQLESNIVFDSLVVEVDTSGYTLPSHFSSSEFSFGVYIHGPHDLEFFNCNSQRIHRKLDSVVEALQVYPNPTSDSFTVISGGKGFEKLEVYDLTGRKVFDLKTKQMLNSYTLSATSLGAAGIYSLRVYTGSTWNETKVVFQP